MWADIFTVPAFDIEIVSLAPINDWTGLTGILGILDILPVVNVNIFRFVVFQSLADSL